MYRTEILTMIFRFTGILTGQVRKEGAVVIDEKDMDMYRMQIKFMMTV